MGGKRQSITPGYLLETGSNVGKRVRLTTLHGIPDQLHPTPRRWKRLRQPSSGVGGEVGRTSQSFSSTWGWVRFAPGTPWNLPSEGTGVVVFPAGQSSQRDQCTGTGPF